ncbi:MAG: ArdC family protein [Planctomycetota bacterium]|nr:ArdC family protein [Planctomycetota bacterium]
MFQTSQSSKRVEKIKHACQTIDKHINELAEQMRQGKSQALIRYLEFTAKFHQYSFRNILLALFQRADITRLAGMRQWNQVGRRIRPGEKGIMILAPMTVHKKTPEGEKMKDAEGEDQVLTLFKPVYVFDISQTEGEPLPPLIHTSGDATILYPAVQEAIREASITLEFVEHIPGSAGACGASYGGRIAVRADLDVADGFRTMVHEFAHEKLHWQEAKESKTIRETEADATAFVVCRHFGLQCDTSDYLLLYDATPKVLLERFETIRVTAGEIITSISDQLP